MPAPYEVIIKNGQAWSATLAPNKMITITSCNQSPNVSLLLYHGDQYLERYNMPDTLKGQHISKLSMGACIHSDMGKLLASIIDSNCDWHDPICGLSTKDGILKKYGDRSYQEFRNNAYRNGKDNILKEIGKYGLGKKDIVPVINLFSKVYVDTEGMLRYEEDNAGEGAFITLRSENKVLMVLSNTPHPLNPKDEYPGGDIKITIDNAPKYDPETDICLQSRPENFRAWQNNQNELFLRDYK